MYKIFVIDDDEISSFLTAILLESLHISHTIVTYSSATEALQALMQAPTDALPDLIFLDLHMPDLSGWTFLDRLQAQQQAFAAKCKVYILTSSVAAEEKAKSKFYPMVEDFLHKPLEEEQLKQLLSTVS